MAQHGESVDIGDLNVSREIIIDDTVTVTLPPDLLAQIGGAGRFEIPSAEQNEISFSRVEDERIEIEESSDLRLSPICPACNHDYIKEKIQMCPECGASRPMVKL